jgi:hypothetical protein
VRGTAAPSGPGKEWKNFLSRLNKGRTIIENLAGRQEKLDNKALQLRVCAGFFRGKLNVFFAQIIVDLVSLTVAMSEPSWHAYRNNKSNSVEAVDMRKESLEPCLLYETVRRGIARMVQRIVD